MNDQEMRVALVANGTVPVAVVGAGENFLLIPMDVSRDDLAAAIAAGHADAKEKGQEYIFAGIMGTVDGQAVARCQPGMSARLVMMHASFEYARLVADRLKRQVGDEVEWLTRLYALPDTRTAL